MKWPRRKHWWVVLALTMLALVIGVFIWQTPRDRGVAIRFKEFREMRGSRWAVLEVKNHTGHPVRYLCPYKAGAALYELHYVDGRKTIPADLSPTPNCPCGLPEHRLESGDVMDYPVSMTLPDGTQIAVPFQAGLNLVKMPRDVVNKAPSILRNHLPNSWYDAVSSVEISETITP